MTEPHIDRTAIDEAFRLCLRRNVLNEADYDFFSRLASIDEVYATIFDSLEFRGRLAPLQQPIGREKLEVEAEASPEALSQMLAHVESTWTHLGETEPHWSVVTDPRFKADSFEANEALYRETGRQDEAEFAAAANRADIDLGRFHTCLEIGCGTGRVTAWLSQRFAQVIAADISGAHLDVARQALAGAGNISFAHLTSMKMLNALPPYDALYSRIVLQHNPPPVIAIVLEHLLQALSPGGVAFFQVPVWISGYRFRVSDYLQDQSARPMEMHLLPQDRLLAIVQDAGCRVRELREDPLGPQFGGISNTLLVEKAC